MVEKITDNVTSKQITSYHSNFLKLIALARSEVILVEGKGSLLQLA